ncbi:MAG: helix-turn-helix domain-containing protein [Clostridiales bacterium]|jgi:transcriptional regulator with XRE-family HTH domain|nr:helix-turn-helix domain-containing protein [Clostridiales bacterium]
MSITGEKIRIARAMRIPKMEQQELLAKLQVEGLDISQSILSKIENGKRPVYDIELKTFAKVLDVSVDWLLGEMDIP